MTPTHLAELLWTRDRPNSKTSLPDNTQHSQDTDAMAAAGLESASPAIERPPESAVFENRLAILWCF
jgi:hypothetical protein